MLLLRVARSGAALISTLILWGCATPVEPTRSSGDGSVSERERIAVVLESTEAYAPTVFPAHLQNAKIGGPFDLKYSYRQGRKAGYGYCVNANIEDKIFGTTAAQRWSEVVMMQDASGQWFLPEKFVFSTSTQIPLDCIGQELQPFPELEAARNRRLAHLS